jgi:hypothetical protein
MASARNATKTPSRKPTARKSAVRKAPAPKRRTSTASRALNAFSIGALAVAAGAGIYELVRRFAVTGNAEHVPSDLMGDARPGPGDRAPEDFRPDPTASVPAGERDAFRPALAG